MKPKRRLNIRRTHLATLLLRIPLLCLAAIFTSGCINNQQVRDDDASLLNSPTTELDCSKYKHPYSLRDYTILGVRVVQINPFIYGAKAQQIADTAIEKANSLDRQAEAWKAKSGACFGKGEYGKQIADKYYWVKEKIYKKKAEIEEKLAKLIARNKALEAEKNNFDNWRKNNKGYLARNVGGMKLEIIWISMRDILNQPAMNTEFHIEATNNTNSEILMPRNSRVWGYENGSDVGGQLPIGVSLTDSFGNKYKLTSITPSFLGSEAKGIRPEQTVTFKVRFGDAPLKSAKAVRLVIDSAAFGQKASAAFEIPIEAFYYDSQK